jgi:hypothetical protein
MAHASGTSFVPLRVGIGASAPEVLGSLARGFGGRCSLIGNAHRIALPAHFSVRAFAPGRRVETYRSVGNLGLRSPIRSATICHACLGDVQNNP